MAVTNKIHRVQILISTNGSGIMQKNKVGDTQPRN